MARKKLNLRIKDQRLRRGLGGGPGGWGLVSEDLYDKGMSAQRSG